MIANFRFGIISDLHIAVPHTIWDSPGRFHLVEVGIPALESALEHLSQLDIDFLLLPGDLTQHGEPENHAWLQNRLSQLPFPVYVIPGNHDVPVLKASEQSIGYDEFPNYYRKFGYDNANGLDYTCEIMPGVRLIGLNSNNFNEEGKQLGILYSGQLEWLEKVLAIATDELVLIMIHHNVIEHLPNQSKDPFASRYILDNAPELLNILRRYGVKLVFTGHLHIQDVALENGVYDITTGSLVSYPHPYRVLEYHQDNYGREWLQICSHRVQSVPDFPNLQKSSKQLMVMSDRTIPFIKRLLTAPPLNLPITQAEEIALNFSDFWPRIANGDAVFDYPQLPLKLQSYFRRYSAIAPTGIPTLIDNHSTLLL
jgi:3',5'-cyclic AMP phosphodiesterase CpdA